MPLYEVTFGDTFINPDDIEESTYIQTLQRKLDTDTYNSIILIAEQAVEKLVQARFGKLVWTKAGALFGHNATDPDIDLLWQSVIDCVGEDKNCLKAVGTLLLYVISNRKEKHWLMYRQDSDELDPDTGKPIRVCTYWIDENFVPKFKKATVNDLASKWGART